MRSQSRAIAAEIYLGKREVVWRSGVEKSEETKAAVLMGGVSGGGMGTEKRKRKSVTHHRRKDPRMRSSGARVHKES